MSQPAEILQMKPGAPRGQHDEGIGRGEARPRHGERAQPLCLIEEHDALLAPVVPDVE